MGNITVSRLCPLCSCPAFLMSRFGLLRCRECGLTVSPSVWEDEANEQLNDTFFGDDYAPTRSFWVRLFEGWNNRRTLQRLPVKTGRLLEIGVGSGSFLSHATAHGFAAFGCDLSPAIRKRVEESSGTPVYASLNSIPDGEKFDVVVMNHVLEHVADPLSFLKSVRARMRPNAVLHLAVPNIGSLEARLPGWNSYEPYHLLYFSPATLRPALVRSGFEIQSITTHESFSGWFLAILRTLARKSLVLKPQAQETAKPRPPAVENIYRLAMIIGGVATLPLRRIQEIMMKGDELVLIARNKGNAR